MAISKQRIYKKTGTGAKDYVIIHPETSSDIVMRPNGYSVEDAIVAVVKRVDTIEKNGGGSTGSTTTITNIENNVTTIQTNITSMQSSITTLQSDVQKLSKRLQNLEGFSFG